MNAAAFIGEMMGVIRKQFFAGRDEREWWTSEGLVKRTILEPARWLHERGVALPVERQRGILLAVFRTVKEHGDLGAVKRMGAYLLHACQNHMKHEGDGYYQTAKAARNAGDLAGKLVKGLRREDLTEAARLTAELAAVRAGISAGRKGACKGSASAGQAELF